MDRIGEFLLRVAFQLNAGSRRLHRFIRSPIASAKKQQRISIDVRFATDDAANEDEMIAPIHGGVQPAFKFGQRSVDERRAAVATVQ